MDDLGRVVLPKQCRAEAGINIKEKVEIYFDDEKKEFIIKPLPVKCGVCGSVDREIAFNYKGKNFCVECSRALFPHVSRTRPFVEK